MPLASKQVATTWTRAWVCLGLALTLLVAFYGVLSQGFMALDDELYVTGNPAVRSGLSLANVLWAFQDTHLANWHPLTVLSHMLDCWLFGLNAHAHHLSNLLFHVANTLLLFAVLSQMTGAVWRPALVAALFGLHPLHVESVAWVAERKDVLSTFFFMLTLWAYGRCVQKSKDEGGATAPHAAGPRPSSILHPPSFNLYLLSLCFFALGLMSKPMLVTVPFVLLFLDYWPLRRVESNTAASSPSRLWTLVWEKWPFFALAAADGLMAYWAQKHAGATEAITEVPLASRLANALISFLRYLGKMIWPTDLAVFYPFPPPWPLWQVAGALLLLLAISGFAILARRRLPYFLVGWFWYVITLAPVLGVIQVGAQGLADRYTYNPLIGIAITVSWTVGAVAERIRRSWIVAGACGLAVVLCLVLTRAQVRLWRSNEALFRHALAVTTNNPLAHYVVASALINQQRFSEGEDQLRAALHLRADYPAAEAALGVALAQQGKLPEALSHFDAAVRLSPYYAQAHFGLANALARQGEVDRAIRHYQEAVRLEPDFAAAHKSLADALQHMGRRDEAITHYRQALRREPDNAESQNSLANALAAQGKIEEAMAHFSEAARLNPSSAKAQNSLGWALATQGRAAEAATHFSAALRINPDYAEAHYNLANLLVQDGRVEEARHHFESALRTQPNFAEGHRQFALLLNAQHKLSEATAHFRAALRLQPDDATTLNGLAWIYATAPDPAFRNGSVAVGYAQRAVALAGEREPGILKTLAAACAEAGQFPQAIEAAQRAIEIAVAAKETNSISTLVRQLKLYQSGLPCRQ